MAFAKASSDALSTRGIDLSYELFRNSPLEKKYMEMIIKQESRDGYRDRINICGKWYDSYEHYYCCRRITPKLRSRTEISPLPFESGPAGATLREKYSFLETKLDDESLKELDEYLKLVDLEIPEEIKTEEKSHNMAAATITLAVVTTILFLVGLIVSIFG